VLILPTYILPIKKDFHQHVRSFCRQTVHARACHLLFAPQVSRKHSEKIKAWTLIHSYMLIEITPLAVHELPAIHFYRGFASFFHKRLFSCTVFYPYFNGQRGWQS